MRVNRILGEQRVNIFRHQARAAQAHRLDRETFRLEPFGQQRDLCGAAGNRPCLQLRSGNRRILHRLRREGEARKFRGDAPEGEEFCLDRHCCGPAAIFFIEASARLSWAQSVTDRCAISQCDAFAFEVCSQAAFRPSPTNLSDSIISSYCAQDTSLKKCENFRTVE